jgi:hypothetical protein
VPVTVHHPHPGSESTITPAQSTTPKGPVTNLRIVIAGQHVNAQLADNPTARDPAHQLPITLRRSADAASGDVYRWCGGVGGGGVVESHQWWHFLTSHVISVVQNREIPVHYGTPR